MGGPTCERWGVESSTGAAPDAPARPPCGCAPARSRLRPRSRGTALVELAFVLPILVGLFIALVEYGYMMYVLISMQGAVRQGTWAGMHQGQWTNDQIKTITVQADLSRNISVGEVTVVTLPSDPSFGPSPGTTNPTVEVIIDHTHRFFAPAVYLQQSSIDLRARSKSLIVPGLRL
jgi:hypothetical protein